MSRRILLAVGPGVLEGALAEVLSVTGCDQIVAVGCSADRTPAGHFDAAVVCADLPADVAAEVVITLPDGRGGGGTGTVSDADGVRGIRIDTIDDILDLLAAPAGSVSRTD